VIDTQHGQAAAHAAEAAPAFERGEPASIVNVLLDPPAMTGRSHSGI
jgi:hypothetical protein